MTPSGEAGALVCPPPESSRFHRSGHVEVNQVPDPKIEQEEDAIVRVTSTAICGSDLHIFNGFVPQKNDMVIGHEFNGDPGHCENSNPEKYGPEGGTVDQKGGGLFGYTDLYGGYHGGQAEYVVVLKP